MIVFITLFPLIIYCHLHYLSGLTQITDRRPPQLSSIEMKLSDTYCWFIMASPRGNH